jgi:cytoskeletal protein CcmA (bactofilin family)
MSKFLSGRQSNLKLGVAGYTENKTVLETTGKVGIGTTDAQGFSLYVVGPTNITGITTFTSGLNLPDNKLATFGDDEDLKIYHDSNGQSYIRDVGTGDLNLTSDGTGIHLQNNVGSTLARFYTAGPSEIHHAGSRKIHTTSNGVEVTGLTDTDTLNVSGDSTFVGGVDVDGHTELDNLNVSGIATVAGNTDLNGNLDVDGNTELDGLNVDGSTTLDNTTVDGTLIVNGDIDLSGDIDVDGHTDLDQLRVAGVSTFAGNVDISSNGNLTVAGNLIVQGTETRLNTTALEVEDINIGIASATPKLSNASLDGAGITIYGSAGDKTLTWSNANSRMEFNTDLYSPNFFVGGITATGDVDFDGNLDVDGHTELDQLRVSGVSTFQGNVDLLDDDRLRFGDGQELEIYSNGSSSFIKESGSGNLKILGSNVLIKNTQDTEFYADFNNNGSVDLYYDNSKKFETTGIGVSIYNDLNVGTGVTIYGNAGIVSAISFYGDGSNLTNTGATLSATSGVERLVTTQLTSGTMVDAATDGDLTFNATNNTLNTVNIAISGGISTNGANYGQSQQLLRSTGSGWEWATVPGIFSVNNILNGFNVLEEGGTVGTAGSIHTLDFRGGNITAFANAQPNGIATITVSDTPTFTSLTVTGNSTLPNVIGITTFSNNVTVGSAITMYASTGIISATKFYGDGSNLLNTGATLNPASGTQRLVLTNLTSGTMVDAATDSDLTYDATSDKLNVANLDISGITTLGGPVTAGSSEGVVGQYLRHVGTGVTWASFPTLRTTQTNTATAGQTAFNFSYNVDFLDVFVNGVKLTSSEYTATNGNQIVLNTPAFADEVVEFHSYNITSTYGGGGGGGGGASNLDGLTDVTIGTLTDKDLLQYQSSSGEWENVSVNSLPYATEAFVGLATAGLASEAFVGLSTAGLASETFVGLATTGLASETFVGLATAGLASETFVGLATAGLASEEFVGLATAGLLSSVIGKANVTIGDNPPGIGTASGDLWWESDTAKGHIYYDDGSSAQWVEFNPSSGGGGGGGGGSYANSDVDSHLNVSSASSGQILSWNGSDYAWVTDQTGGGGISLTDLSVTQNSAGTAALSYNNSNGVFSYTPPDLSNYLQVNGDGSQLTGIGTVVISDNAPSSPDVGQLWWESDTATGHIYYNDGSTSQWVQFNSGSSGGSSGSSGIGTSRFSVSNTTGSIGAGTTADITISGAKAYSLFKIETSHAAWVRLYTDTTSRTNDASRAYTTDPTPGSGVLAEVYTTTTGSNTFKMTPAVTGWNDDATPSTNIYAKVTNNESTSQDITVTLTILRMED